jgi:hypothetical protein
MAAEGITKYGCHTQQLQPKQREFEAAQGYPSQARS